MLGRPREDALQFLVSGAVLPVRCPRDDSPL
jgi:hypothetical protein